MEDWNEIECLFALETYYLLEINEFRGRPQTKKSIYTSQLERMNRASNRKRTQKALEFKVQNVSAIDPRNTKHPISKKENYQHLLKDLYERFSDDKGNLSPNIVNIVYQGSSL